MRSSERTPRPPGIRTTTLSLDADAHRLLQRFAPSKRGYGAFVSRLIHLEALRREERGRRGEQDPVHE